MSLLNLPKKPALSHFFLLLFGRPCTQDRLLPASPTSTLFGAICGRSSDVLVRSSVRPSVLLPFLADTGSRSSTTLRVCMSHEIHKPHPSSQNIKSQLTTHRTCIVTIIIIIILLLLLLSSLQLLNTYHERKNIMAKNNKNMVSCNNSGTSMLQRN